MTQLLVLALAGWYRVHGRLRSEAGQTLAEYSLIVAVIGVAIIIPTALIFRDTLAGGFNEASDCLQRIGC